MSSLSHEAPKSWEDSVNRFTHYGLGLVLRVDYETGQSSVVSFDADGVTEIVSREQAEAIDAYKHPSVTPGLDSAHTEINPWDAALDALNKLLPVDQEWAVRSFERVTKKQRIAVPALLLSAVRRQEQERQRPGAS